MRIPHLLKGAFIVGFAIAMTACGNMSKDADPHSQSTNSVRPRVLNESDLLNVKEERIGKDHTGKRQHLAISQQISSRITKMKEVRSSNVFLSDHSAYVSVVLKDEDNGSRSSEGLIRNLDTDERIISLKKRIAMTVKSMAPTVDRVYISANPDVADDFDVFLQEWRDGKPLEEAIDQFNSMVERIFPEIMENNPMR